MIRPSEYLTIYDSFIVRSNKNNINVPFLDYDLALMFYQELIAKPGKLIVDDITLEGKTPTELHTIWYTFEGQQKPYSFTYVPK
jgi:hypothetical protein